MAIATARNVSEDDFDQLRQHARAHGRSISEELRLLIANHAQQIRRVKRVASLKALRDRAGIKLPDGTTSLDLLREERDSW